MHELNENQIINFDKEIIATYKRNGKNIGVEPVLEVFQFFGKDLIAGTQYYWELPALGTDIQVLSLWARNTGAASNINFSVNRGTTILSTFSIAPSIAVGGFNFPFLALSKANTIGVNVSGANSTIKLDALYIYAKAIKIIEAIPLNVLPQ